MQETGDSGRHRLMLSLLLSLDRKFAMASLTTCNELAKQMETQMEMEQERLSRRQQAATSRHLKIMLQTFWHVAQVRVSKIGPCKRFNSPAAAAASEAATRCDAMRCDLTALRGCTSFGWQSATTNWRSRFSCTTCKFIATVALSLPSGGASVSASPSASAPVHSLLLCRQRLCFGLLCICVSVSVSITIKPGCQTEETLLK